MYLSLTALTSSCSDFLKKSASSNKINLGLSNDRIDSTGFKITHASDYYTSRAKLRRKKYAKLSIGADVLKQIVCDYKDKTSSNKT